MDSHPGVARSGRSQWRKLTFPCALRASVSAGSKDAGVHAFVPRPDDPGRCAFPRDMYNTPCNLGPEAPVHAAVAPDTPLCKSGTEGYLAPVPPDARKRYSARPA